MTCCGDKIIYYQSNDTVEIRKKYLNKDISDIISKDNRYVQ